MADTDYPAAPPPIRGSMGISRAAALSFATWRRLPVSVLIVLSLIGTSCSNRALYENIQQNQLRACEELPIPQQAQCKAQYRTTYEQYRRERDRIGDN